jgi:hypothetical protein
MPEVVTRTVSIGFTGTRLGMSQAQKDILFRVLQYHNGMFHHGDCVGADAEAHDMVFERLPYIVHIHPPIDPKLRAWRNGHTMHEPKHYYERNKDIVGQCDYLLAFPKSKTKTSGGTWYTIHYAMKVGRPFTIIMPDGEIGQSVHKNQPALTVINLGRLS